VPDEAPRPENKTILKNFTKGRSRCRNFYVFSTFKLKGGINMNYYLHVDPLTQRLETIESSIDIISSGACHQRALTLLRRQLDILEQNELKLFEHIFKDNPGIKTPEEGLQLLKQRIEEYNNHLPGLQKLNGSALAAIINDYSDSIRINESAEEQLLLLFFQDILSQTGQSVDDFLTYGEGKEYLINYLNDLISTLPQQIKIDIFSGGTSTSSRKLYYHKNSTNAATATKNLTTTMARHIAMKDLPQRVQLVIKNLAKTQNLPYLSKQLQTDIEQSQNEVRLYGWWAENTELLKGSVAEKLKETQQRKQITYNIATKICNYCGLPQEFNTIIFNFLATKFQNKKDYLNVFVGKNVNAITGLLGELQAALYMVYITGESPTQSFSDGRIQWTGPETLKGKQLHSDLVLRSYGIQVKDSTDD
jgi:hypothetical protein